MRILERDGPGPKQPYGGTNLEPQLAGQCGLPAAPSRWVSYARPDQVSADSASPRIRAWLPGQTWSSGDSLPDRGRVE